MRQYNVGLPFKSINIDIADSFPLSDYGNCYIMGFGDYFTKWVELLCHPAILTIVTKVLVNNFCSCYQVPWELHTNQRKNFELGFSKGIVNYWIFVRFRLHLYFFSLHRFNSREIQQGTGTIYYKK